MKYSKKLLLVLLTIILSVNNCLALAAEEVTLKKTIDKNIADVGEIVTLNYEFKPNDITIDSDIKQESDVVLVIDHSSSMKNKLGNKTRLQVAKEATLEFIKNIKDVPGIKFALITHDYSARKHSLNGKNLLPLKENYNFFKNRIQNIQATGGTNNGDGIRLAYHTLRKFSSENSEKYLLLMSDVESNIYTTKQHSAGKKLSDINFYTGDGVVKYTSSLNVFHAKKNTSKIGVAYLKRTYQKVKNNLSNVHATIMAYTPYYSWTKTHVKKNVDPGNNFISVGKATTAVDLKNLYKSIEKNIKTNVKLKNVYFEETFDPSFQIVHASNGLNINGQKVSKNFGNIKYTYDESNKVYSAEKIIFSIQFKPKLAGNFVIANNGSSYMNYKNIDGVSKHELFPQVTLNVSDPSKILDTCVIFKGDSVTVDNAFLELNVGDVIQNISYTQNGNVQTGNNILFNSTGNGTITSKVTLADNSQLDVIMPIVVIDVNAPSNTLIVYEGESNSRYFTIDSNGHPLISNDLSFRLLRKDINGSVGLLDESDSDVYFTTSKSYDNTSKVQTVVITADNNVNIGKSYELLNNVQYKNTNNYVSSIKVDFKVLVLNNDMVN